MKNRKNQLSVLFLIISFLILASCKSVPKNVPDDLLPEEFFRLAQTAVVDWSNYNAALFYYNEFINRFPDMRGKVIEAEYEIAFIYYKRKNYDEATRRFNLILEQYQTPNRAYFNEWPKVLSEKILAAIEKRQERTSRIRR